MDKQAITDVVYNEYDNGQTRDQIIILLVSEHDLSLNAATKHYARVAKEYGWNAAITSHKAEAMEYMDEHYEGVTIDDAKELIAKFVVEYSVAESTARDYVKSFCQEIDVPYPVLNPREAIFAWFKEQGDDADKEAFMEFATEIGRSKSNANEYWKGYELHQFLIA